MLFVLQKLNCLILIIKVFKEATYMVTYMPLTRHILPIIIICILLYPTLRMAMITWLIILVVRRAMVLL